MAITHKALQHMFRVRRYSIAALAEIYSMTTWQVEDVIREAIKR